MGNKFKKIYLINGAGKACASQIKATDSLIAPFKRFKPSPIIWGAVRPVGSLKKITYNYNLAMKALNIGVKNKLSCLWYVKWNHLKNGAGNPCPGQSKTAVSFCCKLFPSNRSFITFGPIFPIGSIKVLRSINRNENKFLM